MRRRYVNYDLEHGYIDNWLVAGPQAIPVDLNQFHGEHIKEQIIQRYYESSSGIAITPVERGPLTKGIFKVGDYEGSWSYQTCGVDHQIDLSNVFAEPQYLRSWAYTQLSCKTAQEVTMILTSHGPVDLWLNEEHLYRQAQFYEQQPGSHPFLVSLKKGINKILVRFEAVAMRECAYALALQVCRPIDSKEPYPAKSGLHVTIPTLIEDLARRNKFERVARRCFIRQEVYELDDQIRLYWPDDFEDPSAAVIRLQTNSGQIHAEATVDGTPGDEVFLNFPVQIPSGPYHIRMMPLPAEFYEFNMRITHEIPLWNLGRQKYSAGTYGTYIERAQEALEAASLWAGRALGNTMCLFVEIAKMALGQWSAVNADIILAALPSIGPLELLGLLGMLYRFGDQPQFPEALQIPVEAAILSYPYERTSGEVPLMKDSESLEFQSSVVEILAGQYYPQRKFTASGENGQWHRQNGEQRLTDWLYHCGTHGFSAWDSPVEFAEYLAALSYMVDLAELEPLRELSTAMMDKLFTALAINSHRGVFGSTHARTSAPFVKGGLLEPTSGITRLMWGTGVFNHQIAATVSLACMQGYALPPMIAGIAGIQPKEIWNRERHAVRSEQEINKVTYRTRDGMLCSAQDYRPGKAGRQEHIWQATLGADATVFVNHPACVSEHDTRQPNFWVGNAVLPRVAQWKDLLIAIYQLPEDDWMGFTHAYFPIYAFDAYALRDGWAFAQKDQGYLALTASHGFSLKEHGKYAYRELRSVGSHNIWLCHLGQQSLDGDFEAFQQKVLALTVTFDELAVRCTTLRDETLSFGWEAPLVKDGQEQPLSGFKHYENPFVTADYPCKQMDVAFGEDILRLNFEKANDSDPA